MTTLAEIFIPVAGPLIASLPIAIDEDLSKATTVTKLEISCADPGDWDTVKNQIAMVNFAVWDSLSLTIIPGPGLFGRAVTLHWAWSNHLANKPKTVSDMMQLVGYRQHTFGGTASFPEADRVTNAPFGGGRTNVAKMSNWPIGGRTVLYYFFTENDFGPTQVDGARFTLAFNGTLSLYGRN